MSHDVAYFRVRIVVVAAVAALRVLVDVLASRLSMVIALVGCCCFSVVRGVDCRSIDARIEWLLPMSTSDGSTRRLPRLRRLRSPRRRPRTGP